LREGSAAAGGPAPDCTRERVVEVARLVRYLPDRRHIAALVKLTGYLDSADC
jgi:hypothetical protein